MKNLLDFYEISIYNVLVVIFRDWSSIMATPARRTSKTKKRIRRGDKKLTAPAIHFDELSGEFTVSHHVSPKGIYKGKPVINKDNNSASPS